MDNNPIIAISTPHGSGGIGIIRISGYSLENLIFRLFSKSLTPRYAFLLKILDKNNQIIDNIIAIYFKSPYSYTGEDILEIQAHGNMLILEMIISRCLELNQDLGLRIAYPGEFTQRAFLNGKLDLIQAESVIDIINANSKNAIKNANNSLQGNFSLAINTLLEQILNLRVLVESTIDFPEEELDYSHMQSITKQFKNIIRQIAIIQKKAEQGYLLNKGVSIALIGQPNVGKSSLINALSEKEVSIVTSIAGTTRDKISNDIQINGIVIRLIDTAGLRNTNDKVEEIGIKKTWEAIKESSIIIFICSADNNENDSLKLLEEIHNKFKDTAIIKIKNKIDLIQKIENINNEYILTSTKTREGIEQLKQKILDKIGYINNNESIFLARKRHLEALEKAQKHIITSYQNFEYNFQIDKIAEDLRIAHEFINLITGNYTSDDLLGKIFNEFCIGK